MGEVRATSFRGTKRKLKVYYDEICRLERTGKLTTRRLVDSARSKKSPLHNYFEWDDAKCGEMYRRKQAQMLMSQLRVVYAEGGEAPAFMHIDESGSKPGQWVESGEVRSNKTLLDSVVVRALKELEWWCERYESFDGLDEVARDIRIMIARQNGKMSKAS